MRWKFVLKVTRHVMKKRFWRESEMLLLLNLEFGDNKYGGGGIFVIESYIYWQRFHIGFVNYIHYDLAQFHKHTTPQHSISLNKLFSSFSVKYYDWRRKHVLFLNVVSLWCRVFVTVTKVLINILDKTSLYSLLCRCALLAIVWGVLDWQEESFLWNIVWSCRHSDSLPKAVATRSEWITEINTYL